MQWVRDHRPRGLWRFQSESELGMLEELVGKAVPSKSEKTESSTQNPTLAVHAPQASRTPLRARKGVSGQELEEGTTRPAPGTGEDCASHLGSSGGGSRGSWAGPLAQMSAPSVGALGETPRPVAGNSRK